MAASTIKGRPPSELDSAALAQAALASGQCTALPSGALLLKTGRFTGRSPKDRYIVRDATTADSVDWGELNRPLDPAHFQALERHLRAHIAERQSYVSLHHAGGPEGCGVRVLTSSPAHALFCRHLLQAPRSSLSNEPPLTVLHAPECRADPKLHGTQGEAFIVIHPSARTILIGGTGYAGELKKAVFSYLNFVLPELGVLTMHAAVNVGDWGDSAVFFGLSGTGKTTLSADPERYLLGDDEHGWSDAGLFNLEGGCYAKTIRLNEADEPAIWRAAHRPLTLLENVVLDANGRDLLWADDSITENTRAAYPLGAISRVWQHEIAAPPRHVLFLTADAFGVLPPLAQLSMDQAVCYFLAGYTAKLAGTESGQLEPQPTFSACFGAPFLPRPAALYARMLRDRVERSGAQVWLVNTGWAGGRYGEGQRIPIEETRCMVRAILSSELELGPSRVDPVFKLRVPTHIPGVRASILDPRQSWKDPARYDLEATRLERQIQESFGRRVTPPC